MFKIPSLSLSLHHILQEKLISINEHYTGRGERFPGELRHKTKSHEHSMDNNNNNNIS